MQKTDVAVLRQSQMKFTDLKEILTIPFGEHKTEEFETQELEKLMSRLSC